MTIYSVVVSRWCTSHFAIDGTIVFGASLLLALSAKIAVPFYPVPITMQTFVVIGLGLAPGPVCGLAAVALYLVEGAAGFPVFAGRPQEGIGLAYMMGPTGGYLLGYLPALLLAGWLAGRGWDRDPFSAMAAALLIGAVIYVPGLLWLGAVLGSEKPILQLGLYPFLCGDIVKALLAVLAFPTAWKWVDARAGR